ncbi:hypothetical protein ES708_19108 [subsurface metagenome]
MHRKMVEIDKILDNKPTAANVRRLAELRIRNILCFRELQFFNACGKWKNKHPLLSQYSLRSELVRLRKNDPKEFMKRYFNANYNISRYQSFLNRKKINENERRKWQKQLEKHQEHCELFKEVMLNENS